MPSTVQRGPGDKHGYGVRCLTQLEVSIPRPGCSLTWLCVALCLEVTKTKRRPGPPTVSFLD